MNAVAGRVPPHDLRAQAAALSAALLSGDALDVVLAVLRPEDCYGDGDAMILSAMGELHSRGEPVDAVTVASLLHGRGELVKAGGPERLAILTDATPAYENVAAHARIVAEKARERRTIEALRRREVEGYHDHGPTQEWLEATAAEIDALAAPVAEERGGFISGALREAYQQIMEAASRGDGLLGWPTGLRDLDRKLGGFDPGCVTVIGARPGMGKTAIALHMAKTIAATKDPVHGQLGAFVASLEMPRAQLARRESFTDAQVNLSKLKNGGGLTPDEWQRLTGAAQRLSSLPLWIDDTEAMSPMLLRSKARRVRAEFRRRGIRLAVVVVDYLQLMNGRALVGRNGNREQEVAECSKALKVMAKELGVHVVALSQLNRDVEKRSDKRPQMADLRESGSVEQDADNILMLYREAAYNPKCTEPEVAEILVEKQRAGEKGMVRARFDAWCTRWSDVGGGPAWSEEP